MPRPPQRWTKDELEADAKVSAERFVARRMEERARRQEAIAEHALEYRAELLDLLAATSDLRDITGDSLRERRLLRAARFVTIPFISDDDLDSLTGARLKAWTQQKTERGRRPSDADFEAAAEVISQQIDVFRAPWIADDRAPTKDEIERFVTATITLRLNSVLSALRRSEAAARQEQAVREALAAAGYSEFKTKSRILSDPRSEMLEGTYSPTARLLAGASVDVAIRVKAGHPTGLTFIALEAKDTNSSVNSRKRLIEVMDKATAWTSAGLPYEFRTAAVLSGILPLHRLLEAQDRGVWLFWENRLEDLTALLLAS
jgi:hypothetical protein